MRRERQWRRPAGWLAIVALLLLAGFSRKAVDMPRPPRVAPEPTFAETDAPFPSDTASDVVSYADHVALVTAVAEAEVVRTHRPPSVRTASGRSRGG